MMLMNLPNRLYAGLVVPIYIQENDGSHRYEFDAVLLERTKQWRELEPFIWEEKKPETKNTNAIKESWKIMVKSDSPFENGRKFVRGIPRFHSEGILKITEPSPVEDEADFYEEENDTW